MIEVGGTIGDIENELYIDAVRNLSRKVGRENVLFVHLRNAKDDCVEFQSSIDS